MPELPPIPLDTQRAMDAHSIEWLERVRRAIGNTDTVYLVAASDLSDLTSASTARENLGVEIGVDVQAYDAALDTIVDANIDEVADEDNMASDSATKLATQQSIKAYVDTQTAGLSEPAMVFIESQDLSSSATADFTGFNAANYDGYLFEIMSLIPATDADDLWIHTSTDGGSTWDNSAGYYSWGYRKQFHNATLTTNNNTSSASMVIADTIGSAASEYGYTGTVKLLGPHLSSYTVVTHSGHFVDAGAGVHVATWGSGVRLSAADVDAIRFLFSSGNISSGTITMYGLRNSA